MSERERAVRGVTAPAELPASSQWSALAIEALAAAAADVDRLASLTTNTPEADACREGISQHHTQAFVCAMLDVADSIDQLRMLLKGGL